MTETRNSDEKRLREPKTKSDNRGAPKQEKPKSPTLPEPSFVKQNAANPTPQKDEAIWADSIFGIDVCLREERPKETFSPNFSRLPEITREVYSNMAADDSTLNKKLTSKMLSYYSTTLLWARLVDIKAKRAQTPLTQTETDFRRYFTENEYNVPQPITCVLRGIGHVVEPRGKTLYMEDTNLPVAVVGRKGGYFSTEITTESHNLYEELPTLGVAGDVLEAVSLAEQNPVPNIPVLTPHTAPTENLVGYSANIPLRKEEVRQALNSFGIFHDRFDENVAGTRFNVHLVNYVSDTLGKLTMFRMDKVNITAMTQNGTLTQLIKTVPSTTENTQNVRWTNAVVQPKTVSADATTIVGSSYYAGFQLVKEAFGGDHHVWCCLKRAPGSQWQIPQEWINNRNDRRHLPTNYNEAQYVALYDSQTYRTTAIVRRMIHAQR